MKNLLFPLLFLFTSYSASAQLVLHYDFSRSKATRIRDLSGNKNHGTLHGSAALERIGKQHVVNLGNEEGYLDMGSAIGRTLQQANAFTVAVRYYVNEDASLKGNGYFLWAFSTMQLNTKTEGRYHAYKLNIQRSENSIGGWTRETLMDVGKPSVKGAWQYAVYTQEGSIGRLYVNGELVASNDEMFSMETTFPDEAPSYNWVGRAPFKGDAYLAGTLIDEVRVYTEALSAEQVAQLSE